MHNQEMIEHLIIRKNIDVTVMARQSNVSRSKVYEWFNKAELDAN